MIFMVTMWFPPDKAIDVAKTFLKLPKKVPYIKKWRAFTTTGGNDGNKTYHLIYTERGKGEEAILEINKYLTPLSAIEGYRAQAEILIGTTDAYKSMGLKWE